MIARRVFPPAIWARGYGGANARADLTAGLTIAAMLVPQAMAYALLAGLPPEVGLYASTLPLLVYALFGTSRQLAVGPVAIVSLLTASALAPMATEGTDAYLGAAALLALMVGIVHLVVGVARLGFLVNFLSHSVLVGFTSAAAIIIGFSQVKHVLGISVARQEGFVGTVREVSRNIGDVHWPTLMVGLASLTTLFALKRWARRAPAALVVVVGSIVAGEVLDLESRGVRAVGDIPNSLPTFGIPSTQVSLVGDLVVSALVITLVGFMESIAVAKVYARRHGYEVEPNQELVGLGAANVAAGVFGGYPVTGGFSRTAVNDAAGARTPMASVFTALLVLVTIAALTPLLSSLPNAALGSIILVAVLGLIDAAEVRHIARVKRTDLIGLGAGFGATLALGIELGIAVAVVASMLVVFARMSTPHTARLGHVAGTTSYRNVNRFPEALVLPGVRIVRIDAALSFVNAERIKRVLRTEAAELSEEPRALVLDASGIGDIDATGAEMLAELLPTLGDAGVAFHLADAKGPVRDVLHRAGIWTQLGPNVHSSTHEAMAAIRDTRPLDQDRRRAGIDERPASSPNDPHPPTTPNNKEPETCISSSTTSTASPRPPT